MKPHEIFRHLSTDEIDALVLSACADDEIPDKIAGGVLTYMNITLARFSKFPEPTRKAYVRRTLRDKKAADLALYVLSAGLMQGKPAVIEAFLEKLGLPHEGPNLTMEGEIPEPVKETLDAAVDALVKEFPEREAAVYLHAFASQPDVSWPRLDARLEFLPIEDRGQT